VCLGWRPPLSVSQRFRALITERSLRISCGRTGRGSFLQGICHHSFSPPIFSAYSSVKKLKTLVHGGGYFERQRAAVADSGS